jgi:2-iminoacetate synthase ThiH
MIEENVVSAAGAHNRASEETLRYLISEAGFIPQQRDILYKHVNRDESLVLDKTDTPLVSETRALSIN